jgi:hypothetical protein
MGCGGEHHAGRVSTIQAAAHHGAPKSCGSGSADGSTLGATSGG